MSMDTVDDLHTCGVCGQPATHSVAYDDPTDGADGWLCQRHAEYLIDRPGRRVATIHPVASAPVKTCYKCHGPIPSPLLGEASERCPLCGDAPPTMAELAELLKVAMRPLIDFRDRALDVEDIEEDDPLREAAEALDGAFDRLDSTLGWLTEDEGDRCCRGGVLVGQTYGFTNPPEGAVLLQRCDDHDKYPSDLDAAIDYAADMGRATGQRWQVHAIGDGEDLAPQSDVWIMPGEGDPLVFHSVEEAEAAGWYEREDDDDQ